ncbi:MAG: COG4315 family predicted lipoprotein [Actinocrinis sp.]
MRNLPLSLHRVPLAVRIGAPLVAGALLVAGCSSSSSPSAGSANTGAAGAPSSASAGSGSSSAASVTVETHAGPAGTYLTDGNGHTLYLWSADTGTKSNCNGSCASAWPPLTGTATAGTGATASELGTSARSDGTMQVTYNGHPLYYYSQDASAGQTSGQGSQQFGAPWWLVSAAGAAITASGSTGSSPSSSGSSGSSWS